MQPMVVLTEVIGYDIRGYVFSSELTPRQQHELDLDIYLSGEMLEVTGNTRKVFGAASGTLKVCNGNRSIEIRVDENYLRYAMSEYIGFHPYDLTPDT